MDETNNKLVTHKGRVYRLEETDLSNCHGCVADSDMVLCSELPLCSGDGKLFIYKEVTDHEND
jgi:hypothetical protein